MDATQSFSCTRAFCLSSNTFQRPTMSVLQPLTIAHEQEIIAHEKKKDAKIIIAQEATITVSVPEGAIATASVPEKTVAISVPEDAIATALAPEKTVATSVPEDATAVSTPKIIMKFKNETMNQYASIDFPLTSPRTSSGASSYSKIVKMKTKINTSPYIAKEDKQKSYNITPVNGANIYNSYSSMQKLSHYVINCIKSKAESKKLRIIINPASIHVGLATIVLSSMTCAQFNFKIEVDVDGLITFNLYSAHNSNENHFTAQLDQNIMNSARKYTEMDTISNAVCVAFTTRIAEIYEIRINSKKGMKKYNNTQMTEQYNSGTSQESYMLAEQENIQVSPQYNNMQVTASNYVQQPQYNNMTSSSNYMQQPQYNNMTSSGNYVQQPQYNNMTSSGNYMQQPQYNNMTSSSNYMQQPQYNNMTSIGNYMQQSQYNNMTLSSNYVQQPQYNNMGASNYMQQSQYNNMPAAAASNYAQQPQYNEYAVQCASSSDKVDINSIMREMNDLNNKLSMVISANNSSQNQ
jgi:hypothetical protein